MEKNTQKLTLNIPEVCKLLGLSRPVVTAYIRRKDHPMPCIVTFGRSRGRYIVPRAALEQWLQEEAERGSAELARR